MAKNFYLPNGIDPQANFHTLDNFEVCRLLEAAKAIGYRKPKNANGSTARYYFAAAVRQWRRERK